MDSPVPTREHHPAPEALYRSGMLRRFGPLYHLSGLALLLRRMRLPDNAVENIRRAQAKGPVVYVLHTRSDTDWLALNRVLNRRRLPLAAFTTGMRRRWFAATAGVRDLVRGLQYRRSQGPLPHPITSGWFAESVARGMTALVFLDGRGIDEAHHPLQALLEVQADSDLPIQLVPIVVVWNRRPQMMRSEIGQFFLGSQDRPGILDKFYNIATKDAEALVQAGQSVDLQEFLQRTEDVSIEGQSRRLRMLLRRYLYRESRLIRGRLRSRSQLTAQVLKSPEVAELMAREVNAGRSKEAVQKEIRKNIDLIAARISYPVMLVANAISQFLWGRIYSGIDLRDEDVEKIRKAFRAGTPVLVPCHRSHLDYLLISSTLWERDVMIPHIVAGDNLSFFPAGWIFRRCGAFFIKRSFHGDRIFPTVFDRYLRQLVRDEVPIEFFIEGGRSRSGKLLRPKLGVLKMILDASSGARADRDVTFLPMGIAYEELAEGRAMARELAGADKKKEDVGEVARATGVLKRRLGRVYLRVGEPLTVRELFSGLSKPWPELGRGESREVLRSAGEHLMYRISRGMVVLPTGLVAMALLARTKRGIRLGNLQTRVQRLHNALLAEGAVPAKTFDFGGWVVEEALARFEKQDLIERMADPEGDILHVPDSSRVELDHHKNGLMHFMAPTSLYASAVQAAGDPNSDEVFDLFQKQVFLLRYEFTLDPEQSIEAQALLARKALVDFGAGEVHSDGSMVIVRSDLLDELSGITRNFVESYLLVLMAAKKLEGRDIPVKELAKRIREIGQGYLAVEKLRRAESLSIENLKNALFAFKEEQVIKPRTATGLRIDEKAVGAYISDLERLL